MSTNAKQLTKNIEQPTKGVGCKLDPDTYHGITNGLVAGHTVADLPFEAATVTTLKIYNGKDSKFHRYEDAWNLLDE